MDYETGECFRDVETGETPAPALINNETGEMEINYTRPTYKKPFKVPSTVNHKTKQQQLQEQQTDEGCIYTEPPQKRVSVAPAFAILTLLFFVPVFGILVSIIEFLIHMWTHKKNKTLRNSNLYYRSPFHDIVSEFCSLCIEENSKNKITKLQDKRNEKFTKYGIEYVRRIVT